MCICKGTLQPFEDCDHIEPIFFERCSSKTCTASHSFPPYHIHPGKCETCTMDLPTDDQLALIAKNSQIANLEERIKFLERELGHEMAENDEMKENLPAKLKLKGMEDMVADGLLEPFGEGGRRVAERVVVVNEGLRRLMDARRVGEGYLERQDRKMEYQEWDANVRKVAAEECGKAVAKCRERVLKFLEGIV